MSLSLCDRATLPLSAKAVSIYRLTGSRELRFFGDQTARLDRFLIVKELEGAFNMDKAPLQLPKGSLTALLASNTTRRDNNNIDAAMSWPARRNLLQASLRENWICHFNIEISYFIFYSMCGY